MATRKAVESASPIVRIQHISKSFGSVRAVADLSLDIGTGEVFTLLGPSGCGKTTTLRLLAGFEAPDQGEIFFADRPIVSVSQRINVPPHKRDMGMVFQSYAIWPHMTVFENVAYPLKARGIRRGEMGERVRRALSLVGLEGLEDRPGPMLSGGQQQRVAVARSLVYEPKLLLLDEPFSNLDARLREQMRVELKVLQRELNIAVLLVTHDQVEALSLSDRIAVMDAGNVEQVGTPDEVYSAPSSPFVRDFLGRVLVLPATVTAVDGDAVAVRVPGRAGSELRCHSSGTALAEGQAVSIAIRPELVDVQPSSGRDGGANTLTGEIEAVLFLGDSYECSIRLDDEQVALMHLPRNRTWREGEVVALRFPEDDLTIWQA